MKHQNFIEILQSMDFLFRETLVAEVKERRSDAARRKENESVPLLWKFFLGLCSVNIKSHFPWN
jgi:hypothetical protein